MRFPTLLCLFVVVMAAMTGNWLVKKTHAHPLTVTVRLVGPPEEGQPPLTEVIEVPHGHQCESREVFRGDVPGTGGTVEAVLTHHRKILTDADIARIKAFAEEWIRQNGGGNVTYKSDPTNEKNCHGKTFDDAADSSWVHDISGYLRNCEPWLQPPQPPEGTVVVYRNAGQIMHSGRVIPTPPDKAGVWVHSQWAFWGDFDHRVDVVFEAYGTASYHTCP